MRHKTNLKKAIWLLVVLALVAWCNRNAEAATLIVTNTADAGFGSLRTSLARAQNGDTVDATGVSGTILLTSGQIILNRSVTIIGPGPDKLAVNGNGTSRIFYLGIGTINISGLTITNGHVAGTNFLADSGGGILIDRATLTLSNCAVSGNTAYCGGGLFIFNNIGPANAPVAIVNCTFSSNTAQFGGGGIYSDGELNSVTLAIANSTFTNNTAEYGGGVYNDGELVGATLTISNSTLSGNAAVIPGGIGLGGGVVNDGTSEGNAIARIINTILTNNSAVYGGGIYNDSDEGDATMAITNSTLWGNFAATGGGGIFNNGESGNALVTIGNSTLIGNMADDVGGGIYNDGINGSNAVTIVTDSTVSENLGISDGGGIFNRAAALSIFSSTISGNAGNSLGGGIEMDGGTLSIANSTLSANYGGYFGGGIRMQAGAVSIVNSTFSGNFADNGNCIGIEPGDSTLKIGSTILNTGSGRSGPNLASSGTITSLGYNLSSDNGGGFLTATGDQINADPILGPLTNNGGPTFTYALLPGSSAIDQGKNFSGSSSDQRGPGFIRTYGNPAVTFAPGGDGTDIGAVEVQPPACSTVVTTTADSGPGSLRAAIACASEGDTIDATGITGTILLTNGEVLVNKNVAILGPGPANLAVSGNAANRVFHVDSGIVATISGLTISDGLAVGLLPTDKGGGGIFNDHAMLTLSNCAVISNSAPASDISGGQGGGIDNNGTLRIINSGVSGNSSAGVGAGIFNDMGATVTITNGVLNGNCSASGGGSIANSGTLTAVNSQLSGNSTFGDGGGILNEVGATLTVIGSSLYSNGAATNGGGIANRGVLSVGFSTLSSNTGYFGGGCYNDVNATLTITNSTLSGNAAFTGGGIGNKWAATIINSTISGNAASDQGGGVGDFLDVAIISSTLSGNMARDGGGIYIGNGATLEIGSTILNTGGLGTNIANDAGSNSIYSGGYNLSSDNAGGWLTATGDQINTNPLLGPLRDNGGPTFTHALLCGSPAINHGANLYYLPPLYDQRGPGFSRTYNYPAIPNPPGGDGTDIGAFELETTCNHPPIAICTNPTIKAGTNGLADASINGGSYDPDPSDTITVTQLPVGPYPLGTNNVTLIVTDNHGASNSCTATVIVVDKTPPSVSCPSNITVDFQSSAGAIVSYPPPVVSDNVPGVTATSSPPSGATFPIGSNVVTCVATDMAGNTNSCSFIIAVRGPESVKQDVLNGLIILRATISNTKDGSGLDSAIAALAASLSPGLWVNQTHLQQKTGAQIFQDEKNAAQSLAQLQSHNSSGISAASLQASIDRIISADRLLAIIAIQDAIGVGATQKKLDQANNELGQGDNSIAKGQYEAGIEYYRNAWQHALLPRIGNVALTTSGNVHLEIWGDRNQAYIIQTSSNLVGWTTIAVEQTDSNGVLDFDEPGNRLESSRFYRIIAQ